MPTEFRAKSILYFSPLVPRRGPSGGPGRCFSRTERKEFEKAVRESGHVVYEDYDDLVLGRGQVGPYHRKDVDFIQKLNSEYEKL
ncbi:17810_t:CDS:2 [Dentiscutata erythropus]|uniref:17810_t:CDS:1 n=1 Tax=Dentiscutata erythropus TaxID=1348616 RepID=A0A9N9E7F2_9GLOM|nr:17810_t:CDS:2 [Dentiscutata erythropus]